MLFTSLQLPNKGNFLSITFLFILYIIPYFNGNISNLGLSSNISIWSRWEMENNKTLDTGGGRPLGVGGGRGKYFAKISSEAVAAVSRSEYNIRLCIHNIRVYNNMRPRRDLCAFDCTRCRKPVGSHAYLYMSFGEKKRIKNQKNAGTRTRIFMQMCAFSSFVSWATVDHYNIRYGKRCPCKSHTRI